MSIRAKFQCSYIENIPVLNMWNSVTKKTDKIVDCKKIHFNPNYNEENLNWNQATPIGDVMLMISNPDAYNQFEIGKEYFVDISEIESKVTKTDRPENPPANG